MFPYHKKQGKKTDQVAQSKSCAQTVYPGFQVTFCKTKKKRKEKGYFYFKGRIPTK